MGAEARKLSTLPNELRTRGVGPSQSCPFLFFRGVSPRPARDVNKGVIWAQSRYLSEGPPSPVRPFVIRAEALTGPPHRAQSRRP